MFRMRATRTAWGRPPAALLVLLLGVGAGPACTDDESPPSSTGDSEQSSTTVDSDGSATTAADQPGGRALNDIQECEIADGTGMASGAIENLSEEAATYELTVGFTDDATGEEIGRGTVAVDTIEAGGSGDWSITVEGLSDAEVTCTTVELVATPEP